jgi:hypothetical protein
MASWVPNTLAPHLSILEANAEMANSGQNQAKFDGCLLSAIDAAGNCGAAVGESPQIEEL